MAFLEQRLDTKVTRGAMFTETVPGRTVLRYPNGRVAQNFVASAPVLKCELSHGMRAAADYHVVQDAWMVCMFTPYEGMRVKNWLDYTATRTNSRLTHISGTTYQLQRVHTFGGVEILRDIKKPVNNGALTVYAAGGGVLTASIDYTTGIATVPSGTPATWAGEFDVPMFFVGDEWGASLETHPNNMHVISGTIQMEELRFPA
jgi:uncharacterized protein (TIGR02217 family)